MHNVSKTELSLKSVVIAKAWQVKISRCSYGLIPHVSEVASEIKGRPDGGKLLVRS